MAAADGWPARSASTNPASTSTPTTRLPIVSGAVHPAVSAWEKPKTMRNSPAQASTAPGQSIGGLVAGRLLRMYTSAPAMAMAANTRLTYRAQRHDKYWVSAPPRIRPTAPPPAATEPKTPKARPARADPWNVLTSVPERDGARTRAERAL